MIDIGNVREDENEVEVSYKCTWDEFLWMVLMLERTKIRLRFQTNVHGLNFYGWC